MIHSIKLYSLFCFLIGFNLKGFCQSIQVPLEKEKGNGPFSQVFFNLYAVPQENDPASLYKKAAGLPAGYEGLQIGIYYTNYPQMMYSAYKRGLADSMAVFSTLQAFQTNQEDLTYYTAEQVDGQISIAYGENSKNQKVVIMDSNNNESFLYEKPYVFSSKDSLALNNYEQNYPDAPIFSATYEYFDGKAVKEAVVDLLIYPYNKDRWMATSREHRKGQLSVEGKLFSFGVSNGFLGTFYDKRKLAVVIVEDEGLAGKSTQPRGLHDIVLLAGKPYKITGVSPIGDKLVLEKQTGQTKLKKGLFVGAIAPDLDTISLSGKQIHFGNAQFTLVDFWGTWCMPCREELPYLKDAYRFFSAQDVQLIGIALDEHKKLESFIKQEKLQWEQIRVDNSSQLLKDYNINTYPSTFLIDRQGKIIALQQQLRKHHLLETLLKGLHYSPEQFTKWVKEGNVVLTIQKGDISEVTIKGPFTENQALPLYLREGHWQRGLQVEPGVHAYQIRYFVKGKGYVSKKATLTINQKQTQHPILLPLELGE